MEPRLAPASWTSLVGAGWADRPLAFVAAERARGRPVYPSDANLFRALELTPPDRVRVVILGQDPYHGAGQAHGLAFSVPDGVPLPPSLRNVYREVREDLGVATPAGGDLSRWAAQGVLLLNATLSVEEANAGSHQGRGWEEATDLLVKAIDAGPSPVAFLLWGSHAQKKAAFVNRARHLVLEAPHPSPLSAHRGFFGCRHFSQVNAWLEARGGAPIVW